MNVVPNAAAVSSGSAGFAAGDPGAIDEECILLYTLFVPTILRIHGFRIGFYQADLNEPPHVHVKRQSGEAKFWLNPIEPAASRGFRPQELGEVTRILKDFEEHLLAAWHAEEMKRGDGSGENTVR